MDEKTIKEIVSRVIGQYAGGISQEGMEIPVEISGRHVHLSQEHLEALFGKGHSLTKKKDISQPGQYLCEERVTLIGPKGQLKNVAVLGPVRERTQAEISLTDGVVLGLRPPVRLSGDLEAAETVFIMAGKNMIRAEKALIAAKNHVHITPGEAEGFGVVDGQKVRVVMRTERGIAFENVPVRVSGKAALAMHIDYDEANACALEVCGTGLMMKSPGTETVQTCASSPAPNAHRVDDTLRFISEEYARKLVETTTGTIVLNKKTVITPLARDVFSSSRRKVEFV